MEVEAISVTAMEDEESEVTNLMGTTDVLSMDENDSISSATHGMGGDLGKNEFLTLLITQLQNQDPLAPMDNTAMVSQLAQFSALEQMENLNAQFAAGRMEQSLMQALVLQGQSVSLELVGDIMVEGVVEKVLWTNDNMELQIEGTLYSLKNIMSISLTGEEEDLTEESEGESETASVTEYAAEDVTG